MQEQEELRQTFEVFNPILQQKINKARQEKLYPDKLQLDIDDKNEEYDGYRETIVNGNCWLIPEDISFDDLNVRIVMRNPNCDPPDNKLLNLIKSLK